MEDLEMSPTLRGSVKSMISIFENQTVRVNGETPAPLKRSKSLQNSIYTPVKYVEVQQQKVAKDDVELQQIEQQINHLKQNLEVNYRIYSRENHIYYQNQILFILTDLANVETKNRSHLVETKSELTEILKRLNKKLNTMLPEREDTVNVRATKTLKVQEVRPVKETTTIPEKPERKVEVPPIEVVREEEVDSVPVSVKSLKAIFERNATPGDAKPFFRSGRVLKKSVTFNSTSDFKYVGFRAENGLKRQSSLDLESTAKGGKSFDVLEEELEENVGVVEESSTSSESDDESDDNMLQVVEEEEEE